MIVRALPYADLLEADGEALLLTEGTAAGTLLRLSAIGGAVIRLATDGIDADELATILEEQFGAPAGQSAADALGPVLDALADQHLVELAVGEVAE